MYVHNCICKDKKQNLLISIYVCDCLLLIVKNKKFQKLKGYIMSAPFYTVLFRKRKKFLHAYLPT